MRLFPLFGLFLVAVVLSCSGQSGSMEEAPADEAEANVMAVEANGESGDYTFAVTVRSPDTGCDQYADWWEVVSADGKDLIYRRILAHPHIDEQPFTRSGGTVPIPPDSTVVVRAHMNNQGYGGQAMRGTPAGGFSATDLPPDFGKNIDPASPECRF